MTLVEEMQQWQTDLEELGKEKGKAEGRLEQAMTDMESAGFKTLKLAKTEQDWRVKMKADAEESARKLADELKIKYEGHIE